ncbi:hypothetical protein GQ44DRAFT_781672 [Phaeosphaeriaceae sp. PMI808]|nr:hypothetical protein GQ44DRAFT_781672 [Phaeosphaeriaceae sp. PMI808]
MYYSSDKKVLRMNTRLPDLRMAPPMAERHDDMDLFRTCRQIYSKKNDIASFPGLERIHIVVFHVRGQAMTRLETSKTRILQEIRSTVGGEDVRLAMDHMAEELADWSLK